MTADRRSCQRRQYGESNPCQKTSPRPDANPSRSSQQKKVGGKGDWGGPAGFTEPAKADLKFHDTVGKSRFYTKRYGLYLTLAELGLGFETLAIFLTSGGETHGWEPSLPII